MTETQQINKDLRKSRLQAIKDGDIEKLRQLPESLKIYGRTTMGCNRQTRHTRG